MEHCAGCIQGNKDEKNPTPSSQAREKEARVRLDKANLRQVIRGDSERSLASLRFQTGTRL